jgi:serine/threonine-protein phosphatase 2A regulatory subunit B
MSNAGRRRRSLTSIAPSPVSSSSFPSGAREAQAPPSQLPSWKFSQVLGELPLAAAGEGHDNGTLQDDGTCNSHAMSNAIRDFGLSSERG